MTIMIMTKKKMKIIKDKAGKGGEIGVLVVASQGQCTLSYGSYSSLQRTC